MTHASLQILSDLHLENPAAYDQFEIPRAAPYLALLGDIGHASDERLYSFLTTQLDKFEKVFFLLGNHEPYEACWKSAKSKLEDFAQQTEKERGSDKFILLDRTRYDLSTEVTILGCTLYSHIIPDQMDHVSFGLNDFYYIKDWTVEQHNEAHATDVAWLNDQITEIGSVDPHRDIIVLTHHSPTTDQRTRDPAHANSKISSGFMTDLANELCWKNPKIKVWAFGHTHFNCDFVQDGTDKRIVSNQRGYYFSQAKLFDPTKTIQIL